MNKTNQVFGNLGSQWLLRMMNTKEGGKTETVSAPDNAQVTLINGNGKPYTLPLPKLYMLGKCNDVALAHIKESTGLDFVAASYAGFEAQPENGLQITALLMTYNFKTRYYNNGSVKNTLFLKNDHHNGFDVDSICFDCVKHNHIHAGGLSKGDRLSC